MASDPTRRGSEHQLPDGLAELERFPTLDAFYEDDERRRRSPEWDYGVHWRLSSEEPWPRWRVSWVVVTGDVYAIAPVRAPVLVLGNVPPVGEYPFGGLDAWGRFHRAQRIEQVMDGWAVSDPPLLEWVVARVAS